MEHFLPEEDTIFAPFFVETSEVLFWRLLWLSVCHVLGGLTVAMAMAVSAVWAVLMSLHYEIFISNFVIDNKIWIIFYLDR